MNRSIAPLLACAVLLTSCIKEEPRPSFTEQDIVIQSRTIKISPSAWEEFGTPGDDIYGYAADVTVRLITEEIATSGTVRVQLQRSNGGLLDLPVTIAQGGPDGLNWNFSYHTEGVRLRIDRNGGHVEPPSGPETIKVSVIPPTVP